MKGFSDCSPREMSRYLSKVSRPQKPAGMSKEDWETQRAKEKESPKRNVRPSHVYSGIARHG